MAEVDAGDPLYLPFDGFSATAHARFRNEASSATNLPIVTIANSVLLRLCWFLTVEANELP